MEAGMRLLSDESGATKTEYGILAVGMTFAVTVAMLPPGATCVYSIAGTVLMLDGGETGDGAVGGGAGLNVASRRPDGPR
jgi:Flp pilus assembly pilin Flp